MLSDKVRELMNSEVSETINSRFKEFQCFLRSDNSLFSELCFCILTANFRADRSILIQKGIGDGFITLSETELAVTLKEEGHRFPNTRAKFIVEARKYLKILAELVNNCSDSNKLRLFLADNVTGLGLKESSHFLRNIGFNNLAIIDFHIIDILIKEGLIERPKTLTKAVYLKIEKVLEALANQLGLSLSELDLYLWYLETGKVLK